METYRFSAAFRPHTGPVDARRVGARLTRLEIIFQGWAVLPQTISQITRQSPPKGGRLIHAGKAQNPALPAPPPSWRRRTCAPRWSRNRPKRTHAEFDRPHRQAAGAAPGQGSRATRRSCGQPSGPRQAQAQARNLCASASPETCRHLVRPGFHRIRCTTTTGSPELVRPASAVELDLRATSGAARILETVEQPAVFFPERRCRPLLQLRADQRQQGTSVALVAWVTLCMTSAAVQSQSRTDLSGGRCRCCATSRQGRFRSSGENGFCSTGRPRCRSGMPRSP